ncbi:MAG: hypothetical protein J4400_03020 [Candidatus Aenigmarchaeota archaeon]|nr:hypothetical protein [Candidatus Aenigmarchaeota archaeon]
MRAPSYSPIRLMRIQQAIVSMLQSFSDNGDRHFYHGNVLAARIQGPYCMDPRDTPYVIMPFVISGEVERMGDFYRMAASLPKES